jgi:DNA-binding transcriptional ArsR family regulator
MNDRTEELLDFFKALADANRLRIVGLLAQREYSVEQLAELLGLRPSTVSHHLGRLSSAGLVTARAESYYNFYRLEYGTLEEMSQRLLADDALPAITADIDMGAYDRKVIASFCDSDGRIKQFPAQRKKFEVLLKYVAASFEQGRRYDEAQVNEILDQFSDDHATLRRGLVDHRLMAREGGGRAYWLTPEPDSTAASIAS